MLGLVGGTGIYSGPSLRGFVPRLGECNPLECICALHSEHKCNPVSRDLNYGPYKSVLRYNQEGRGFDSLWDHRDFH